MYNINKKQYNKNTLYFFILIIKLLISCEKNTDISIEKEKPENKKVKLVFTGDIMTHPTLVYAFDKEDVIASLKDFLKGDIVFANLEHVVNTNKPPMPYPHFNGSTNYLKSFTKYFNIFSLANNHAYDQGASAAVYTIDFVGKEGVVIIGGGTNRNSIAPLTTNINGIEIFFDAYTMLDNGLSHKTNDKDGKTYFMNYYSKKTQLIEKVTNDLKTIPIETLKIASLHFGLEYTTKSEKETVEIARSLIENGIDIIIGHHPHVPRPVEIYKGTNNSGVIIYSLGNFIANHKGKYPHLDIGTIVSLEINQVNDKQELNFSFVPTYYAFFNKTNNFRVAINAITKNPENELPLLPEGLSYSKKDIQNMIEGYKLINSFYSPLTNYTK